MRLLLLTTPQPLEAAVGPSRRRFALAAGLSALLYILYLAQAIDTMRINDRVVLIGGVQSLLWITVIVGLATATLTALGAVQPDSARSRACPGAFGEGPPDTRRGNY